MGSNSYHLLIAHWQGGGLRPQFTTVERVRTALLMEGGRLTPAAEQGVLDCLRRFRGIADQFDCQAVIAVGTSALRQASNADSVLQAAESVLGHPVHVVSGEDEARLIYQAVASSVAAGNDRALVLDIGGGSTELIVGRGEAIECAESVDVGCVRSLKTHFADGELTRSKFDASVQAACAQLQPLSQRFNAAEVDRVLGCSGTALGIAEVLGVQRVNRAHLDGLRDSILERFTRIDQVEFACLDSNRSSLLVPGLALLTALFEVFAIAELEAVQVALREGIAISWFLGEPRWRSQPTSGIAI